jgi:hypothetical protein
MVRFALAIAAALSLAACYTPRYPSEAPGHDRPDQAPVSQSAPAVTTAPVVTSSSGAPVTSAANPGAPGVLRPGFGVIESVSLLPSGSAAAGGTVVALRGYELRIRMDDGTAQHVIMQDTPTFRVGDRVEVTSNSLIRR